MHVYMRAFDPRRERLQLSLRHSQLDEPCVAFIRASLQLAPTSDAAGSWPHCGPARTGRSFLWCLPKRPVAREGAASQQRAQVFKRSARGRLARRAPILPPWRRCRGRQMTPRQPGCAAIASPRAGKLERIARRLLTPSQSTTPQLRAPSSSPHIGSESAPGSLLPTAGCTQYALLRSRFRST
eukprot:366029-Chlamydomonas_euryale.AAC.50